MTGKSDRYSDGPGAAPAGADLIDLRGVDKIYKTDAGEFVALKAIDLTIGRGEFISIVGRSGSGKTTLINMLTGIDRPTEGSVIVAGRAVQALDENELAEWRGRNVGVVFQFFQLLPTLTVLENVILPMGLCGIYEHEERLERGLDLLALMGLEGDLVDQLPSRLSGGQQQRVAIARALANDPPIIVTDEPTGNLDSNSAGRVMDLFETLVDQGKTVLMVTHDKDLAARAPRTLTLADGELVNEHLAKALPSLDPGSQLYATRNLRFQHYPAGEPILLPDAQPEDFYIVIDGHVEVLLTESGEDQLLARLGPNQFFGEIALLDGGTRTALVRASRDDGVTVAGLGREVFLQLVNASEETQAALNEVVQQRLHQQQLARERRAGQA